MHYVYFYTIYTSCIYTLPYTIYSGAVYPDDPEDLPLRRGGIDERHARYVYMYSV